MEKRLINKEVRSCQDCKLKQIFNTKIRKPLNMVWEFEQADDADIRLGQIFEILLKEEEIRMKK